MKKDSFRAALVIAISIFSTDSVFAANACPGSLNQSHPHPFGPYNFESNSVLDVTSKISDVTEAGSYKYGIVSCIYNPDPNNALRVNWLIPHVDGWVPVKSKLISVPKLTNDPQGLQLDGCLEYGNRGDTTDGKFIGLKEDQTKAEDEKKRGCRAAISNPKKESLLEKIENIVLKFTNFVPGDAKDPAKTMLKIEGVVGVKGGDDSYTSYMSYVISPFNGSDGKVGDLKLRPNFSGATERFLPAFTKTNGPQLNLTEKGFVSFNVVQVKNPVLTYGSYQILDRANVVVGSIAQPLFVPGPQ